MAKTVLFTDRCFEAHETGKHPESPARLRSIMRRLTADGLIERCEQGEIGIASATSLASVHTQGQIDRAAALAARGGGYLDPDTPLSAQSFDVALRAAGSAIAAVDQVLTGRAEQALCLIRPPGHHATGDTSMGFCVFNNVAAAARHAQARHGAGRVLIVDWDVHHGNGTQDIFYDDDSVVFFSIHRYPFYPGTGDSNETGTGKGLGATINVPVGIGVSRTRYMDLFRAGLELAAARCKPDLIVVSAGFDAHAADPIGGLGLTTNDFSIMTAAVKAVASVHCGGRIVSCLEGGYDLEALGESVSAHLRTLLSD